MIRKLIELTISEDENARRRLERLAERDLSVTVHLYTMATREGSHRAAVLLEQWECGNPVMALPLETLGLLRRRRAIETLCREVQKLEDSGPPVRLLEAHEVDLLTALVSLASKLDSEPVRRLYRRLCDPEFTSPAVFGHMGPLVHGVAQKFFLASRARDGLHVVQLALMAGAGIEGAERLAGMLAMRRSRCIQTLGGLAAGGYQTAIDQLNLLIAEDPTRATECLRAVASRVFDPDILEAISEWGSQLADQIAIARHREGYSGFQDYLLRVVEPALKKHLRGCMGGGRWSVQDRADARTLAILTLLEALHDEDKNIQNWRPFASSTIRNQILAYIRGVQRFWHRHPGIPDVDAVADTEDQEPREEAEGELISHLSVALEKFLDEELTQGEASVLKSFMELGLNYEAVSQSTGKTSSHLRVKWNRIRAHIQDWTASRLIAEAPQFSRDFAVYLDGIPSEDRGGQAPWRKVYEALVEGGWSDRRAKKILKKGGYSYDSKRERRTVLCMAIPFLVSDFLRDNGPQCIKGLYPYMTDGVRAEFDRWVEEDFPGFVETRGRYESSEDGSLMVHKRMLMAVATCLQSRIRYQLKSPGEGTFALRYFRTLTQALPLELRLSRLIFELPTFAVGFQVCLEKTNASVRQAYHGLVDAHWDVDRYSQQTGLLTRADCVALRSCFLALGLEYVLGCWLQQNPARLDGLAVNLPGEARPAFAEWQKNGWARSEGRWSAISPSEDHGSKDAMLVALGELLYPEIRRNIESNSSLAEMREEVAKRLDRSGPHAQGHQPVIKSFENEATGPGIEDEEELYRCVVNDLGLVTPGQH